ncbi:MAG: response regulator [Candidatus Eremiobacteraeota bacterium]|nr:response regulator [Candidatus Eremiobacteraeota bacterium]
MNGDLGTGRDYEAYRQQYLFDTRHEAVRAGLGALVITFLVEVALNQWVAPLPLGWFLLGRLAVAAELALVYQLRSRFRQVNQLIFIWLNFATFAIFVGSVGAVLDARIGIPFYATAAYGLAAAGAQYPLRTPQALAHPASLATLFFVVYATTSNGWLEGVWVAGLAALTGPFTAFYGSLRLDQALREAFDSNRALRASNKRLAVTVENIRDGVFTVDARGKIEICNAAAAQLLGLSLERARGAALDEVLVLVDPDDRRVKVGLVEPLWESPPGVRLLAGPDSPYVRLAGARIDSDEATGTVFVLQDITQLREQEDERLRLSKLESLGVLAGGIAHDFNNLLTAILGNLSLSESDLQAEHPAQEGLREATYGCKRARDLARQLLTFSKGGDPIKRAAELGRLVKRSVNFVLTGSKVKAEFEQTTRLMALVDPGQLDQAFQNLTINALEAMPQGGLLKVRLEPVEGHPSLGQGRFARITFEDQGPGIPKDLLGKIFDPYFTTKGTGSGLGLATTFSVARRHGGLLTASSPAGARFELYLPLLSEESVSDDSLTRIPRRGQGRVLVMDDEESVRRVTVKMLERLGYSATAVADGAEALQAYSARPFDVVLMDLTVPGGLGGQEATRRLLELDPQARVVVASGYSNDPVMSDFARYGFRACLTKPFGLEELGKALEELGYR